jgi:hypothetical protein
MVTQNLPSIPQAGRGEDSRVLRQSSRQLKIPIKKILSVMPHSDGLQIMREGERATPQIFKLDDPAFAADAIARLNQL